MGIVFKTIATAKEQNKTIIVAIRIEKAGFISKGDKKEKCFSKI